MSIVQFLIKIPIISLLKPSYPDQLRLVLQLPIINLLMRRYKFQGNCLNAGCGEGMYIPLIRSFKEIQNISNIDIKISNAMKAEFNKNNHNFAEASLTKIPYEDDSFECILCTEVLEHIEDHDKVLNELFRVLKKSGRLLLSVPQTPAPWDPAHFRQGYTKKEIDLLLKSAGFNVVSFRDCFFMFSRAIMHYWRNPLVKFGKHQCPYLPRGLLLLLCFLDLLLQIGKPWDIIVMAEKT
jgi:SAM-dependent methyltransferase